MSRFLRELRWVLREDGPQALLGLALLLVIGWAFHRVILHALTTPRRPIPVQILPAEQP